MQAGPGGFPDLIQLPLGWQAEGITTGPGSTVCCGSAGQPVRSWKGDLRTGAGDILVPRARWRGLGCRIEYSRRLLYVSGGNKQLGVGV